MKKVLFFVLVPVLLIAALFLFRKKLAEISPDWGGRIKDFFDGIAAKLSPSSAPSVATAGEQAAAAAADSLGMPSREEWDEAIQNQKKFEAGLTGDKDEPNPPLSGEEKARIDAHNAEKENK